MATSKYEAYVLNLLNQEGVLFKREQSFSDLRGFKGCLRFDFIVYNRKDYSIAYFLEINGEQHYKAVSSWGGEKGLKKRQEYDRKKMSYALAKNIPLICVPYWDVNENLTYKKLVSELSYKVRSIWHNDSLFIK